ncbi:kinase-like domain-containing protein [Xylogone sp. PMI_703]|nr:kinase-like domain-containing protein [Xylogone sp. PMI_703]
MSPSVTSSTVLQKPTQQNLIAVGIFSVVHRLGDTWVRKLPRADDVFTRLGNLQAIHNEATIYALLGDHPRIARCLSIGKTLDYVDLEFYPHGTLMSYIQTHKDSISDVSRIRWARQIIEAVVFAHKKGVVHSDLALRQFFLDSDMNARLADFGASGYPGQEALGMEGASHSLPRDPNQPNTILSDLFALGSTLYELGVGETPYHGCEDDVIENRYAKKDFPTVDDVFCGCIIIGCWRCEFPSAEHVLLRFEELFSEN